jgi:hypothetical protein
MNPHIHRPQFAPVQAPAVFPNAPILRSQRALVEASLLRCPDRSSEPDA